MGGASAKLFKGSQRVAEAQHSISAHSEAQAEHNLSEQRVVTAWNSRGRHGAAPVRLSDLLQRTAPAKIARLNRAMMRHGKV